ncbi:MAG TPA: hypothetical protein VF725_03850 [Ktedonobacterales bacterium]
MGRIQAAEAPARAGWRGGAPALAGRLLRSPRALTLAALALALAIRLWLIGASHGMLDADEAALGIQAENILRGQFPVYFPGQNYMGSWDAYLMAPLIHFFGPSALVIRAVTLGEYLIYLPLVGALAARLYGERARVVALLVTALSPLYVTVTELRMLGGYIETLTLGAALLLLMMVIRQRWRDGRATRWQWALVGAVVGLGLWIDTLTLVYVITAALWLAPAALQRWRAAVAAGEGWRGAIRAGLPRVAPTVGLALLACALAAAPMLLSPQTWAGGNPALLSTTYAHGLTVPGAVIPVYVPPDIWTRRAITLGLFFWRTVPVVIGAQYPYPPLSAWGLAGLSLGLLVADLTLITVFITWRGTGWRLRHPLASWRHAQDEARWNVALPLLLAGVTMAAYLASRLLAPPIAFEDQSRYILPVTTAGALALAYAVVWLSRGSSIRPLRRTLRGPRVAAFMLGLLLLLYALPYSLSNPIVGLDSPYNLFFLPQHRVIPAGAFPAQDTALLDYLEARHIRAIWADQWVGDVVMYLSDQRIASADYINTHMVTGYNRFPAAYRVVASASRPSYIIAWDGAAPTPLARALDRLGVRYQSARFGRYWVITPMSRTVSPAEVIPALQQTYW